MKPPSISDSEWEVMNVLWTEGPQNSTILVEGLQRKTGWQPRTIRTLIDRLVKKKAISTNKEERPQIYRAELSMKECVRQESRSFLKRVFAGEPMAMLLHLVEDTRLKPRDIEKLKEILERKDKK